MFLSIDVLYYVILNYVSCIVWTPGRVAAASATVNGDPNKITKEIPNFTMLKGIFNLSFLCYFYSSTNRCPICEALENLPGLCG
jgi:hypothetical protein